MLKEREVKYEPPGLVCYSKKDSNTTRQLRFAGNGKWDILHWGEGTSEHFIVIPSIHHLLLGKL